MQSVTLFHGTTESRAAQIQEGGWKPEAPARLVESTCSELGRSIRDVMDAMRAQGRYATFAGRTGFVSFATTPYSAASWAQRAPEVRWEVLTTIWNMDNPAAGGVASAVEDYFGWIWPLLDQDPVVMEVHVPVDQLRMTDGSDVRPHVGTTAWDRLTEVEAPLPIAGAEIVAVHAVDRRVYPMTGAALTGMGVDAFIALAELGRWGDSTPPPRSDPHGAWWPWAHFQQHLPPRPAWSLPPSVGG
jgi:hypothetical protein